MSLLGNQGTLITNKRTSSLELKTALESPQLSILKKDLGIEILQATIIKAITEVTVLTNSDMSLPAKNMLAESLINDFWYMRMDEILLVLSRGIKGVYGKIYGALNYSSLYQWFAQHDKDRNEKFDESHELKKTELYSGERMNQPLLAKDFFEESVDSKVKKLMEKYKKEE